MVDLHLDLRRVELEVTVAEDEEATRLRLTLHLLEHLRELLVIGRRGDDELDRRSARRARQRRVAERDDLPAGDAVHLGLQILQDLRLRAGPFLPRLEQNAGERLVHVATHAVDGEHVLLLRHRFEHVVEVVGDLLEIVDVRRRWRLH